MAAPDCRPAWQVGWLRSSRVPAGMLTFGAHLEALMLAVGVPLMAAAGLGGLGYLLSWFWEEAGAFFWIIALMVGLISLGSTAGHLPGAVCLHVLARARLCGVVPVALMGLLIGGGVGLWVGGAWMTTLGPPLALWHLFWLHRARLAPGDRYDWLPD